MLKLRVMGTKEELELFKSFLMNEQKAYETDNWSDQLSIKGTSRHFRMYAELIRNSGTKENEE